VRLLAAIAGPQAWIFTIGRRSSVDGDMSDPGEQDGGFSFQNIFSAAASAGSACCRIAFGTLSHLRTATHFATSSANDCLVTISPRQPRGGNRQ